MSLQRERRRVNMHWQEACNKSKLGMAVRYGQSRRPMLNPRKLVREIDGTTFEDLPNLRLPIPMKEVEGFYDWEPMEAE
jgi:hypothetical protein